MSIEFINTSFVYGIGSYQTVPVLNNLNIKLENGKIYGLVGETGSGKTTMAQLMNGLLKPTKGKVEISQKTDVGISIKYFRKLKNKTKKEIAAKSEFSIKSITNIEKGKRPVHTREIKKILDAIGIRQKEFDSKCRFETLTLKSELITQHAYTGNNYEKLLNNFLLRPLDFFSTLYHKTIGNFFIGKKIKKIRTHIGLVFQFAEYQLFSDTVEKDIAFGPKNFNISKEKIDYRVKKYIKIVGLSEDVLKKSPFDLSGGQKRRVAIAGVLAMEPEILIFDEPVAGLDPKGEQVMMNLFTYLNKKLNKTIIMITHNMDHILQITDKVIVIKKGKIEEFITPQKLFSDKEKLKKYELLPPFLYKFSEDFGDKVNGFKIKDARCIDELKIEMRDFLIKNKETNKDAS